MVLVPVLNKVDLPSADPAAATAQMVATFDVDPSGELRSELRVGRVVVWASTDLSFLY